MCVCVSQRLPIKNYKYNPKVHDQNATEIAATGILLCTNTFVPIFPTHLTKVFATLDRTDFIRHSITRDLLLLPRASSTGTASARF